MGAESIYLGWNWQLFAKCLIIFPSVDICSLFGSKSVIADVDLTNVCWKNVRSEVKQTLSDIPWIVDVVVLKGNPHELECNLN